MYSGPPRAPDPARKVLRGIGSEAPQPNPLCGTRESGGAVAPRKPVPGNQRARILERLLRPLSVLTLARLPSRTLRKSRLCLLDALGNMVAASDFPEAISVGRANGPLPEGRATILGWGRSAAPFGAAFHNAVHIDLLEAQDGHRRAGLHPCEGAIPAGLAVGESGGRSLGAVLAAVVAGYEVSVRFGAALFPGQTEGGFYPDGTCGPLGAAVAASRLLESDLATTCRAVSTAAFAVPISLMQAMRSSAKPLVAGMAAELGLRAAFWAREGLGADGTSFAPPHGLLDQLAPRPILRRLERGPRDPFAIDEVYLKPYPGGRHAHGPLDAARQILAGRPTDPRDVRSVEVRTYRAALSLTGSMPVRSSPLAELTQSLRYVIAAGISDGTLGPERFRPGRRSDPFVLALAHRVLLREDPKATRQYPRTTTAEVTIHFKDRPPATATVRHRWGDPERPMTVEEVREKFVRSLSPRVLAAEAAREWDRWWNAQPDDGIAGLLAELSEVVGPAPGTPAGPDRRRSVRSRAEGAF